jgi:hypothetical protein
MRHKYVGVEIMPNVIVCVTSDVKPKTIEALKDLAVFVQNMPDEELKEIELYANYLKSKHKRKVGRPRRGK